MTLASVLAQIEITQTLIQAAITPPPELPPNTSDIELAIEDVNNRLNRFRYAATIYVSKSAGANDSNNGTSPGEPLLTLFAAVQKANAYVAANPGAPCLIQLAPGVYTENFLPLRIRRNICIAGDGILRTTTIKPAAGQEMNGFFKVDSGFMAWGLTFAGHQANSITGEQSWAISFDEQANNTALGASSLGAYIQVSPYIQNCTSLTAEDDSGVAPSVSTGDTGGGILVDGNACALNSPIRSMVVDSYTQVNLGGPGCLVRNDGYAQLVSFFGTFCTYHVRTETGGQVNLSGGTTDFGTYGLMADGFSPQAIYTGQVRAAVYGAIGAVRTATVDPSTDLFTSTSHGFVVGDRLTVQVDGGTLPGGLSTTVTYFVIASGLTANAFRLSTTLGGSTIDVTSAGTGTLKFTRSGAFSIDVVSLTANRLGPVSRPNPGQLLFPRLNYPTAGTAGSSGSPVTISSVSGAQFTVTLATATFAHVYAGGGTVTVSGVGTFNITSATYNHSTGVTTLTAAGYVPLQGQSITLAGLSFICPSNSGYVITGSVPIDASGNTVSFGAANQAGYRVDFYSSTNPGLRNSVAAGQVIDFRLRSQISAPGHTFEYVGAGTNYDALPWRGGIPVRANERVETNNGRVFSSNTNELGDFKVGDAFSVDGTTGAVTINTSLFNLSGLNFIGPFSRNGGFSTVGVQLQEVSNNASLLASTGAADGNTVPTQFAVKTYVDTRTINGALQPIIHKGSDNAGVRPLESELTPGEIYLNRGDGRAYSKAGGVVVELSGIYRWGEVPVGSRSIGVPGGIGFGIADPALDLPQIDVVRRLAQIVVNEPAQRQFIESLVRVILDVAPQLGGNLDVLTRKIFTSITNGDLVLEPNGTGRLKLDNHFFPIADASPNWALRTDGAGNLVFGAVDRWGLTPVGSETIGTPGGLGFGIADPLFTEKQFTWLTNFLNATQSRVTDLEQKVAILYDLYLREVSLRNSGLTIGVAGAINFGVGPAITTGTPVGISEQDYYPVHANSDSLM